jgi:hypothetical protein
MCFDRFSNGGFFASPVLDMTTSRVPKAYESRNWAEDQQVVASLRRAALDKHSLSDHDEHGYNKFRKGTLGPLIMPINVRYFLDLF